MYLAYFGEHPEDVAQGDAAPVEVIFAVLRGETAVQQFGDRDQHVVHIEDAVAVKVADDTAGKQNGCPRRSSRP